MSLGRGISAALSGDTSLPVPTAPFPLCQGRGLCDTVWVVWVGFVLFGVLFVCLSFVVVVLGFFHIGNCAEPTEIVSFKSPNHHLIWLPAGHAAGLSQCSWPYSCLL